MFLFGYCNNYQFQILENIGISEQNVSSINDTCNESYNRYRFRSHKLTLNFYLRVVRLRESIIFLSLCIVSFYFWWVMFIKNRKLINRRPFFQLGFRSDLRNIPKPSKKGFKSSKSQLKIILISLKGHRFWFECGSPTKNIFNAFPFGKICCIINFRIV